MENENLDIRAISSQILKYWWMLVLLGSSGALIGCLLNIFFIKPTYSATSTISASINFSQVGHLTQYEQDQFFGHILTFLRSDQIIDEVISSYAITKIDKSHFLQNCFLERQLNEINFRCILTKPDEAQALSILWKKTGFTWLKNALDHAAIYQSLLLQQTQLESCFQQNALGLNSYFDCSSLKNDDKALVEQLNREKEQSQGMLPGFTLVDGGNATFPKKAIRHQMNLMVFSGAMIGIVISLILISFKNVNQENH